jgi:hypothetical protein
VFEENELYFDMYALRRKVSYFPMPAKLKVDRKIKYWKSLSLPRLVMIHSAAQGTMFSTGTYKKPCKVRSRTVG